MLFVSVRSDRFAYREKLNYVFFWWLSEMDFFLFQHEIGSCLYKQECLEALRRTALESFTWFHFS